MAVAVLTYANRAAVARALTERGYSVSKMQVNRWAGGAEMPTIAARMILELFLHGPDMPKEAAPPEWAERLEAKVDSILANQNVVGETYARQVIEALGSPDLLEWAQRIGERTAVPPSQSDEGSGDRSGGAAPGTRALRDPEP
jgi:predicted GTPase